MIFTLTPRTFAHLNLKGQKLLTKPTDLRPAGIPSPQRKSAEELYNMSTHATAPSASAGASDSFGSGKIAIMCVRRCQS
jgi:hypothetical protein